MDQYSREFIAEKARLRPEDLGLAPMYRPQKGDGIRLDFVNREDMERELRAGQKREGIPILVSTELAEFGEGWKSLARLLLVKGMSWAYEKEVRLLVDLEGAQDIGKEDENGWPIKVIESPPEAIKEGSSGFLVGGTGHERASKRPHLRTVDRWNADWGALALMVERWLVPLIPFPSYKLCASDRPGAVKGARFARRSEPLTARTDLESYEGEGKGIPQPSSHLPTKNPEYPKRNLRRGEHPACGC